MPSTDVTVVVCTYNRANMLRDTLASLFMLATDGQFTYEILVVDNASTDNTSTVIQEAAQASPVPLRGVLEPNPGVSFARNRGIAEAKTPWIAFFDDDQIAHPQWLKELRAIALEKQVRCTGGANRLKLPEGGDLKALSRASRALLSETVNNDALRPYTRKWAPGTGNLLIQRSVFDEVGTFDVSLRQGGEDTDLYRRIWGAKIRAWYTPKAISYHVIPAYRLTDEYFRWKALRNGGQLAHRNFENWGRLGCCAVAMARLGQAAIVHLPRFVWAKFTSKADQEHDARCLLWRAEGYLRHALHYTAPRLFAQRTFFSWLEFRGEQQIFCAQNS
jgi:glycosyltransferase involved in cell wall biosynthesis